MSEHPISNLMSETMSKIKEMVDVNTIIGTPITTADGTTVIPVSKVTFGFASGGSDFAPKHMPQNAPLAFGGGGGAGVTVSPVCFLIIGLEVDLDVIALAAEMPHMRGRGQDERPGQAEMRKQHLAEVRPDLFVVLEHRHLHVAQAEPHQRLAAARGHERHQ